jgi:L-fuculose-phosphate aldolase
MESLGWVAATDGNVSVKVGDGEYVVTPSGVRKGDVREEMLVNTSKPSCYKVSSEFKMHLRCYEERGDVGAVIHAHPPHATAFAIAGVPLDDYSLMEAVLTIGSVPVAPYATPSTAAVGDSVAPLLKNHDVILLKNHGAIAVGVDLLTAFNRMDTLELWARTLLNARLIGEVSPIARGDIARLCELRGEYGITGRNPIEGLA